MADPGTSSGDRAAELRARVARASLYLCVGRRPDLLGFADTVLAAGVDILQLRDKTIEAREELALAAELRELCHRHGALFAVNDRADVALLAGADVLHLGQGDLRPDQARAIVGREMVIGLSSHAVAEADAADADPDVDYFCTGPVWPTPTKPGRPAPGLGLVEHAAQAATKPWFAIGGIENPARLADVRAAGASRVVVVRALTEASDPAAAVAVFAGLRDRCT